MVAKISNPWAGGAVRALAIATPMNDAVHGVATMTARTPVKKLPR